MIACLVDFVRLTVYSGHLVSAGLQARGLLLIGAPLAAFLGAWIGSRFIEKLTLRAVQALVAVLLFGIAVGLGSGLL